MNKGRWIPEHMITEKYIDYHCSCCGYDKVFNTGYEKDRFCSNCGAKMNDDIDSENHKQHTPKRIRLVKARKTAQWKIADDGDGLVCSNCGRDFCIIINPEELFNYCPKCGSKIINLKEILDEFKDRVVRESELSDYTNGSCTIQPDCNCKHCTHSY